MLFNSHIFLILFLPIVLTVFLLLQRGERDNLSVMWLVLASLVFYGWAEPWFVLLLGGSLLVNYLAGKLIFREKNRKIKRFYLYFFLAADLITLGYYKYTNFFLGIASDILSLNMLTSKTFLPLAISFITLRKISYIVDMYVGLIKKEYSFWRFCLSVTFFPQLIAGPIVYHKEMVDQFVEPNLSTRWRDNFIVGSTLFTIGLFKKVGIADSMSLFSSPVFEMAQSGSNVPFFIAWYAAISFMLQIYFDLSGHADMAIGLARMFGIRLPMNFNSPYKAKSITEFWQRWHMTMTRFFTDYVLHPLSVHWIHRSVERKYTPMKQYFVASVFPTILTFLIVGLWHGTGWSYVVFGIIHGVSLVAHRAWQYLKHPLHPVFGWLLTFVTTLISLVFFRAGDLSSAWRIVQGMLGLSVISLPIQLEAALGGLARQLNDMGATIIFNGLFHLSPLHNNSLLETFCLFSIFVLLAVCLVLPNSNEMFWHHQPVVDRVLKNPVSKHWMNCFVWKPSPGWAFIIGIFICVSFMMMIDPLLLPILWWLDYCNLEWHSLVPGSVISQ
ncbi:MAG: MBOAT family protein [Magnetococcales bacterium]|nr:MBOAT family protein [Magnetococcales bacterium]